MGVGGQHLKPASFARYGDPVPIVWEAEWGSGPVWTVSPPTGIRSQDRPEEGVGNAVLMLKMLLSRPTNAQHILIILYISSVLLHVSTDLHHPQEVLSF